MDIHHHFRIQRALHFLGIHLLFIDSVFRASYLEASTDGFAHRYLEASTDGVYIPLNSSEYLQHHLFHCLKGHHIHHVAANSFVVEANLACQEGYDLGHGCARPYFRVPLLRRQAHMRLSTTTRSPPP